MKRTLQSLFHTLLAAFVLTQASAADDRALPPPQGEIILEVDGQILNHTEGSGHVLLDFEGLRGLGEETVVTTTPWTQGPGTFRGVRINRILEHAGVDGDARDVLASALNAYQSIVPAGDIIRYNPLIAYEQNNRRLTIRGKGPLWIIYPLEDFPETNTQEYFGRWVWQLERLTVQ